MNLKENEILKKYSEAEIVPSPKAAIDMIHKILRVIDYELETVNHSRRIEWQNKEIEHYTEKNSQILQYKKWVNGILFVIMAIAIYGLIGFGHGFLVDMGVSLEEIGKIIFSVIFTALVGFGVGRIEKKFDKD